MTQPTRAALAGGALTLLAVIGTGSVKAQEITRTELNRVGLSGSETLEVVVSRTEIPPGARVPLHSHSGDEHVLVLQGGPVTMANGNPYSFETGMTFAIPAGRVHGGMTATGSAPVVLYSVSIVEKNEPYSQAAE